MDVELVWSNALLYNNDPSHMVYVCSPAQFASFAARRLM
jgi:hypothetical protein